MAKEMVHDDHIIGLAGEHEQKQAQSRVGHEERGRLWRQVLPGSVRTAGRDNLGWSVAWLFAWPTISEFVRIFAVRLSFVLPRESASFFSILVLFELCSTAQLFFYQSLFLVRALFVRRSLFARLTAGRPPS